MRNRLSKVSLDQCGPNDHKKRKSIEVCDETPHSSNSKPAKQAKSRDCAYADNEFDVADILDFGKSLELTDSLEFYCQWKLGDNKEQRSCSWVATNALSCYEIAIPFIEKQIPHDNQEMDYLLRKSATLLKVKKQLTEKVAVPIYEIAEEEINRVSVNKVNMFCRELKQLREDKNRYSKRYHEKKADCETLEKDLQELQNKVKLLEEENEKLKNQVKDGNKRADALAAQNREKADQIKILVEGYDKLIAPFRKV